MKQREVERAVARATGESVKTVKHLGFSLMEPVSFFGESEIEEITDQAKQHVRERRDT